MASDSEIPQKVSDFHVCVIGCKDVGIECVKEIINAGVASVTLWDNTLVDEKDPSSKRSVLAARALEDINTDVVVSAHTASLTDEFLLNFDVVVIVNQPRARVEAITDVCHYRLKLDAHDKFYPAPIGVVVLEVRGAAGRVFVDFGEQFECVDETGLPPLTANIAHISQSNPGIVTVPIDESPHQLKTGDRVLFHNVEGMIELNDGIARRVEALDEDSFSIGDTSHYSPYLREGYLSRVKLPVKLSFSTYRDTIRTPLFCYDAANPPRGAAVSAQSQTQPPPPLAPDVLNRLYQLHLAFTALQTFEEERNRLPSLNSSIDANRVVSIAQHINQNNKTLPKGSAITVESVDSRIINQVAAQCLLNLTPISVLFASIAAQEVIKFAGKWKPIHQTLYLDFFDLIPFDFAQDSQSVVAQIEDKMNRVAQCCQDQLRLFQYHLYGPGTQSCPFLKGS
eukprot:TRINITY_DN17754_c0_g1_i1.p1 TRINITY_DN17754_c0_g1~~TRINITY_DN17754_c0_g1_i1.p1  ORF type:complete len:453 (+),score=57.55 TRINITY_DN17754_c0_g1_i1:66-1424(+)